MKMSCEEVAATLRMFAEDYGARIPEEVKPEIVLRFNNAAAMYGFRKQLLAGAFGTPAQQFLIKERTEGRDSVAYDLPIGVTLILTCNERIVLDIAGNTAGYNEVHFVDHSALLRDE